VATLDHAGGPVLSAALCVLLALRLHRARGLGRRELMPVLVAAGAVAVSIAALNLALLTGAAWLWPLLLEVNAFTMLAVPVAFGVAALRRRLDRAVVADVVLALAGRVDAEDVREELRRALGDPSLDVVWAPDEVREAPADRLVLPVDGDDGARVAVVLADPGLRRHARLVRAVTLAGRLALERTRLADGVRAQLDEIRASGARIAEAALVERRRLERDLQDGAQQRLLALTTQLDALAGAAPDERTRLLVSAAREDLQGAVAELRDLARGLHPAVLVEGGLAPALRVVAARIPLDVELDVPCGRWASAAETAAYFVACEALTNAVKHASASRARVQVRQAGDRLTVEVADDGTGGAVVGAGSGLRGLRDRVGSLGGTLEVRSPPGAGTRVVAGIPLVDVPSVSTFG
jgi:signal transduction histidine kinase